MDIINFMDSIKLRVRRIYIIIIIYYIMKSYYYFYTRGRVSVLK